jgi:hypothetical protein
VIRFVRYCAVVGLLVPFVVYPLWQSVNEGPFLENKVRFESIAVVLWPSSIILMALEGPGSGVSRAFIVILSLAANAVLYGCVGLLLWGIWRGWKLLTEPDENKP